MQTLPRSLRILIADDHPFTRSDLRRALENAELEVCAEASTGADAVTAAVRERPDLCLLDVRMPGGDGITATEAIRHRLPATKIVLITAVPDEDGVLTAARAGADGYLAKDMDPRTLPRVVRAVADGETSYPRHLMRPLLDAVRRGT